MFQIGDLVKVKNSDMTIYRLKEVSGDDATIVGYSYRVIKTVSIAELEQATEQEVSLEKKKSERYFQSVTKTRRNKSAKVMFGRILHLDGDEDFLNNCLSLYQELGIHAQGIYMAEKLMPLKIEEMVLSMTPDIVVITGHDTFNGKDLRKIENYGNTANFVKCVRRIRKRFGFNEIVIIAGACASNFEALIGAGANFASSPKRINTHTFDPAVCAIKVATTSAVKVVNFEELIKYVENGRDALGGIETNGKARILF